MLADIIGDLADIVSRVRDLPPSASRSAALQSLDDATRHLANLTRPSVAPTLEGNLAVRHGAEQAFRNARAILKGIL